MILRSFSFLLLLWIIGFAWFAIDLPRPASDDVQTDSVVVLTGGAKRIDRGLELLEAKKAQYLLISGVDRDVKPHELAVEYGRSDSLFECCIDLGFQSVDTRSNALETARWAARRKDTSLRLVTSDWHMRRAKLELERAIPPEISIIADAVASAPSLGMLFKEYNKYLMRQVAALAGV
ncbi:YdcF family protein [Parasphingorhabdus sp. JC815]|uniref:YdcF family protein n=1 Tax=Parasphingorhabdus sp. JC815 TaxID=3232140 RepID=UPI003458E507